MNKSTIKLLSLVAALLVGIALGYIFFSMQQGYRSSSSGLRELSVIVGLLSVLLPVASALRAAFDHSKDRGKELFVPFFRNFAFTIVCVSSSLIVASITSAKLYCAYGACSEFAGLEVIVVLMWLPFMAGVSAVLSLAGLGIFLGLKRK